MNEGGDVMRGSQQCLGLGLSWVGGVWGRMGGLVVWRTQACGDSAAAAGQSSFYSRALLIRQKVKFSVGQLLQWDVAAFSWIWPVISALFFKVPCVNVLFEVLTHSENQNHLDAVLYLFIKKAWRAHNLRPLRWMSDMCRLHIRDYENRLLFSDLSYIYMHRCVWISAIWIPRQSLRKNVIMWIQRSAKSAHLCGAVRCHTFTA